MADCRYCHGTGDAGPVHVSFGDGRGEWREHMPCAECGGSGHWSPERYAAYEAGQMLRSKRIAAGETILAASQRLGVSCAEISRMERGLPPKESAHG